MPSLVSLEGLAKNGASAIAELAALLRAAGGYDRAAAEAAERDGKPYPDDPVPGWVGLTEFGLEQLSTHVGQVRAGVEPVAEFVRFYDLRPGACDGDAAARLLLDPTRPPTLDALAAAHLRDVLARCGGDKAAAAKVLGVSVKTVYNRLNSAAALPAAAMPPHTP